MDDQSRTNELLTICMALSSDDCRKIFMANQKLLQRSTAMKIIKSMFSDTSAGDELRSFQKDIYQQNDSRIRCEKERLLNCVAKHSGKVLHAFLVVLKKENIPFYTQLEQEMRSIFNGKECELELPRISGEPIDSAKLQNVLTDIDWQLVMCPTCKEIMNCPVLLGCLHSCCYRCREQSCARCCEYIDHSAWMSNYHLHRKIAYLTNQNGIPQSLSNGQQNRSSESGQCIIPKCRVHRSHLALWCNNCKGYRCQIYASHECNRRNPKHEIFSPQKVADALWSVLVPFASDDDVFGSAEEASVNAMKSTLNGQFRGTLSILEKNRTRLQEATDRAFCSARKKIDELYSSQSKVVDGLSEQLNQANRYLQSIRNDHWPIVHQFELLFKQLTSLLLVTKKSLPNLTIEQRQLFGFPVDYEAVESNRFEKSLVIRCLGDNYDFMPVTTELLGQPDLFTPDPSSVSASHNARQQVADLSMIEEMKRHLNDCKLKLCEIEKKYEEAITKIETMEKERPVKEHGTDTASIEEEPEVHEREIEGLRLTSNDISSDIDRIQDRRNGKSLVERVRRNMSRLIAGLRKVSIQHITIDLRAAETRDRKPIITQSERNAIDAKSTDEEMASELLDVVINRGDEAVLTLISSLRSDQVLRGDLADLLEDPHGD